MNDPIKEFVKQHRDGFDDLRPSADVFSKIQQEIGLVKSRSRRIRIYRLSGWAVAASVLFGIGLYFYDRPKENSAAAVTAKTPIVVQKLNEETSGSPAKRAAVIRSLKKAVLISKNETPVILSLLSNELSSGTRISGLQKAGKLSAITPALMETIVEHATQDPSSNVRLAAIQVIVSRLNQPGIPAILEKVFIAQDDPFVQTELIDVIAAIAADKADPDVKEKLIALTENDTTAAFVKDRAYALLLKHNDY
jgi:hypothetical protein